MSSIETNICSFVHPLIALIFLVELAPWTVVDGGFVVDGVLTSAVVTWSSSTMFPGALLTLTSVVLSSSNDVHHSYAPLVTLLPLLLV